MSSASFAMACYAAILNKPNAVSYGDNFFLCACTLPMRHTFSAELIWKKHQHLLPLLYVSKPGYLGWTKLTWGVQPQLNLLYLGCQTSLLRSAGVARSWKQSSLLFSMFCPLNKSKLWLQNRLLKPLESTFCASHLVIWTITVSVYQHRLMKY